MISIVIPTLNEESNIKETLDSLTNQRTKKKYEIIVVDSNSEDRTGEIAGSYRNTKVFKIKEKNIAKARNFGIKKSKGEFVLFIDSGFSAPEDWVDRMFFLFKSRGIVGLGGGIENRNQKTIPKFTSYDKIFREGFQKGYVDVISFTNAGFRKKVFEEVGFLDEFFSRRCETSDICYRITNKGFKLFFDPDVKVFRHEKETFSDFMKKSFLNGYWHFYLYAKHMGKSTGDSYRSKKFIFQPLAWLFLPLGLFNPILFALPLFLILILSIDFVKFTSKGINPLVAYFLVVVRSISELFGFSAGLLSYLLKRLRHSY